jgi:hypothetical protein
MMSATIAPAAATAKASPPHHPTYDIKAVSAELQGTEHTQQQQQLLWPALAAALAQEICCQQDMLKDMFERMPYAYINFMRAGDCSCTSRGCRQPG